MIKSLSSDGLRSQGKVISVKGEEQDFRIEYDDLWTEWLSLSNERFRIVAPRAVSAGCNSALLVRCSPSQSRRRSLTPPLRVTKHLR